MINSSTEVLVLAPTFDDSKVAVMVLEEAGIKACACDSLDTLTEKITAGCGAVVIAEEALKIDELSIMQRALANQATWSDLPVIILSAAKASPSFEVFAKSGNISILERPFSRLTLVRSVEVALRARRQQYQVRDLLEEQRQATERRDEFFATLSHELRTPLNVILGWLEILKSGKLDENSQQEALEVLERNARIQKGLIDDILDISRIVTGKMFFDPAALSVQKMLESMVASFNPKAQEKGIDLHVQIPAGEFVVMADEQRLAQVMSNLLTNAIKFTPQGGKVAIDVVTAGQNLEITVADNGQGIDPQFLPHIFDRLKQEDMSTTRSHGGLGLGLAIAHYIVQEHKGTLQATSAGRGRGAVMKVTLPLFYLGIKEVVKSETTDNLPQSLKGVRVLVVDDSPDILQLIQVWLKKAEAEVKLANSAKEALETIGNYYPHVLLSDIGMPDIDGYQLIAKVRALSDSKVGNVPAVALTAYARDEERKRALNAGFQMHISKPISSGQLISAVAQLASGNRV